ncbi:MAG TPA: alpha/beta fold hydrolase, partial [Actinomycetota bacterium]|nr:alpha/beta fold hydrolase [Actinomycetota bacterium]
NMWEPQIESLRDRFRFITVDLQGFGGSDAPDDPGTYSVDTFADQGAAVLDAAGVDKANVVGLSMGGYISFSFWRRHRDRISAFVLADTKAEADPPEGVEKRTTQQQLVRDEGTDPLIEGLVGALLAEPTREKKPDVVEKVRSLMQENPAAGFIGALEAMKKRPDSTDVLSGIDVPTLVIVGENDGITPPDAARKIHEHVGGSRLVVIPEVGHLSNLEAPEAFNGAVAEFLSGL